MKVTYTTGYSPQSNELAEWTHGTLLSLARTCLHQETFPLRYWGYAVKYAAECKNEVRHTVTGEVPYTAAHGTTPPNLTHMRPFGCRTLYQPFKKSLQTFEPRIEKGLCLRHEDGGIYYVWTELGVVRTKHERFNEDEFPEEKRRDRPTRVRVKTIPTMMMLDLSLAAHPKRK